MTFRSEVRAPLSQEAMEDILDRTQESLAALKQDGPGATGEAVARFTGFDPEVLTTAVSGYVGQRFDEALRVGLAGGRLVEAMGQAMGDAAVSALVFGLLIGRETAPNEETEVDGDGLTT